MDIRIDEGDLRALLSERDHLKKQVAELQGEGTRLITENRVMKKFILNYILFPEGLFTGITNEEKDERFNLWLAQKITDYLKK